MSEGRPVLYSGNPECGDGHAFVCDGYENGYFHLNLGWGGYANGYYELDAINTSSTYELNQNQWIEYGIQPPSGKTAVETCVINDVKYALDKTNNSVIICKSNMTGDVSIPASVNIGGKEYTVSAIESYGFKGCKELTSLVIPENISYIGAGAFEGCERLESVTINSNAIASFCKDGIYDYATSIFKDTPLRCVTFGDAVTSIGDYLFDGCSTLEEVDLGVNTKTIGRLAFADCTKLSSIHFHQNLEVIGELAFSGCLVTTLYLPDNLKRIETGAFNLCSGLSSVIIGESLEEMSLYAFTNCSSLTSITINSNAIASKDLSSSFKSLFPSAPIKNVSFGDAVTAIGPYLFYNCSTLEEIHFGENIETINDAAFCNCKNLSSVSFLPKLENIGIAAFAGCTSLTSVTIPENVMTISDGAFSSCSNLTSVIINTNADIFYPSRFENTPIKSVTFGDAVTSICNGAFQNILDKIAIEEIVLGENVESIGRYAFAGSKIKSIFIPSKVKDIAESAFYQCNELSSIVFAEGLETIDRYAFAHCKTLKSIQLPNSLTTIGSSAFEDCSSLTSVTIPENAISIDFSAFKDCPSLESVTINCPSVKGWFREMTSIKEVHLGEKVSEIGWLAFYGCSGLTTITIPAGVTSIDSDAFQECSNLTTVTLNCNDLVSKENPCLGNRFGQQVTEYILGNTVTRIGEYAFSYCENLNSVTIPQSVTSIGMHAFRDCSSLTSITIPHSVTSIETSAFMNCSSLTSACLSEGLTVISKELFEGCSNLNNIIIPEDVTTIENLAFLDCSSLTSITIPESVNSIGRGVFEGCISLKSIKIPKNITCIDDYVFSGCSSLTSIEIPKGVTSIGEYSFEGCSSLTSIVLPESMESIGWRAFEGCNHLINVSCYAQNVPNASSSFSVDEISSTTLYVPYESLATYKSTAPWKYFGTIRSLSSAVIDGIVYEPNKTTKTALLVSGTTALGELVIPASITIDDEAFTVTSIEESAFSGCANLTSITIPNGVTSIGDEAFKDCSSLTSITIPEKVSSIGFNVFDNCQSLSTVTINSNSILAKDYTSTKSLKSIFGDQVKEYILGNSVSSIGCFAFQGCTEMTGITIPEGVVTIGRGAFSDCTGLTTIAIPWGVTALEEKTFYGCSSLTSIYIPESVTSIHSLVFYGCSSLRTITFPESVNEIGGRAFMDCSGLRDIICCPKTIPDASYDSFDDIIGRTTLHVPFSAIQDYRTLSPWKNFSKIAPIETVYTLTYILDGIVYKVSEYPEGETINPEKALKKEGYTFSGWSEIPETMPAHDVVVTGSFTVNSYNLTYMVDGEEYKTSTIAYGMELTPEAEPTKEGYSFSGWSEIPETMPANNVVVTGTFTINSYIVTFKFGDVVLMTEEVEFGAVIPLPESLDNNRYTLVEWLDVPDTMPAHDITIQASFTDGVKSIKNGQVVNDYYQLNGIKQDAMHRGLNIIRTHDGKTHKVLVK